jgi:predicted metal-binding membrane protein
MGGPAWASPGAAARPPSAPRARISGALITATLLAVALVTWIVTIERMRGMDAGPGTDLGAIAWFVGIWVTMMAAMMLPSTAPMVLVVHRVTRERTPGAGAPACTVMFVLGYLAVWTATGLAAYGAFRAVRSADPGFLAWDRSGPLVAGIAVAAAGVYQVTPLKQACLRHCRTPLHFVMHRWRRGGPGAIAMGVEHGAWCLGCCAGLMLVLFAVGVMSVLWMAVVAALVFAEKVLPFGGRLSVAIAAALVAFGIWIALSPGSAPGLTQPGMAMHPDGPAEGMPGDGHPMPMGSGAAPGLSTQR